MCVCICVHVLERIIHQIMLPLLGQIPNVLTYLCRPPGRALTSDL